MAAFQDQMRAQQKKVFDLLGSQDQAIEPGIQKSQDLITAMRPSFASGAQDLLGSVGAQYGLSPNIVQSGVSAQNKGLQQVDRANQEALDRARMTQKGRIRNLTYNTLFDNFVNAGQDLNAASTNARNIALNQQGQDYQATANDAARRNLIERNNINRSYAAQVAAAQSHSDPYEQAVIASLVGLGAQAPLAYGLYKSGQPKAAVPQYGPVAGQNGNANALYDAYYNPQPQFAGMGGYYGE